MTDPTTGHRAPVGVTAAPSLAALALLVVMAAVHAVRGAPVDAAVFTGAALLVVVEDRVRGHRRDTRPGAGAVGPGPRAGRAAGLVGAGAVVAVSGAAPVASPPVTAAVVTVGALVAALVFSRRPPDADGPVPRPAGPAWPWSALALLVCLQELFSFLHQPDLRTGSLRYPTMSVLVDPLLQSSPGRALAAAAWLAAGWWLLRVARVTRVRR